MVRRHAARIAISIGQHSDKGRKPANQDFHGALIPEEPLLSLKGIAIVLADGISSSNVSHVASESAVKSFLTDYYCTSESWSVKTSAQRVIGRDQFLAAFADPAQPVSPTTRTRAMSARSAPWSSNRPPRIFSMSAIARIYRVAGNTLEQFTEDHRRRRLIGAELSGPRFGDQSSDRDRLPARFNSKEAMFSCWRPTASTSMSATALSPSRSTTMPAIWTRPRGSSSTKPAGRAARTISRSRSSASTSCPTARPAKSSGNRPNCRCRRCWRRAMVFDGYRIVREIHASSRSHIYLAVDIESDAAGRHQDSLDRPARRSGLSEALHDGRVGRPPHRQPACAEAAPADAKTQLSLCRDRIRRRADPDPVDDRQSEAGSGNGARHRRADRQGPARLSPAWRCCIRTCGRTTS